MDFKELPKQSQDFLDLVQELLYTKNYRKKDLADELKMASPAFSGLCKGILPVLAQLNPDDQNYPDEVQKSFKTVNNVSMRRVTSLMPEYLSKLKELKISSNRNIRNTNIFSVLNNQAEKSYEYLKNNACGLWDCFYYSSKNKGVKKEPFLITANENKKVIEVYKGSKQNSTGFHGTAFLVGDQTMVIQLIENEVKLEETVMMYLNLPPKLNIKLIKGMFLGVNYTGQPIARRVVMRKKTNRCSLETFNKLPTSHDLGSIHFEIIKYLSDKVSFIHSVPIQSPTYDEKDLTKELEAIRKMYKS